MSRAPLVAGLVLMALVLCQGCFGLGVHLPELPELAPPVEKPLPKVDPVVVPADELPEAKRFRQLSELYARQLSDAASTKAQLQVAKDEKARAEAEARLAPLRATVTWVTWLGFLVGAGGVLLVVALHIWALGIGVKTAYALAIGGPAVAMFAQGFGVALPWLPVAGLGLLAAGAAWLVWMLFSRQRAAHISLASAYRATAEALGKVDPRARELIDQLSVDAQHAAGVLHINDQALQRAPTLIEEV